MEIKIKTSKAPQRTWNMCKRHFPPQLSLNRESEPFQGPHNPGCISLRLSSQGGDRMDKGDIESPNMPNVISHLLSHATKVSPAVVFGCGWATPLLSLRLLLPLMLCYNQVSQPLYTLIALWSRAESH